MSDEHQGIWAPCVKCVLRDLPESFWDVAGWEARGWRKVSVDVADRKRIVTEVLREALT